MEHKCSSSQLLPGTVVLMPPLPAISVTRQIRHLGRQKGEEEGGGEGLPLERTFRCPYILRDAGEHFSCSTSGI